jgi:hypothetical protein
MPQPARHLTVTPPLVEHAIPWIEASWRTEGSRFRTDAIPVMQFDALDVDDSSPPFNARPRACWWRRGGALVPATDVTIACVPYVAFALLADQARMNIQLLRASRCGYGFEVRFGYGGEVLEQNMRRVP